MKTKKNRRHHTYAKPSQPAYPNAADRNYYISRATNVMTALVSGIGFVTTMVFLVTMI